MICYCGWKFGLLPCVKNSNGPCPKPLPNHYSAMCLLRLPVQENHYNIWNVADSNNIT